MAENGALQCDLVVVINPSFSRSSSLEEEWCFFLLAPSEKKGVVQVREKERRSEKVCARRYTKSRQAGPGESCSAATITSIIIININSSRFSEDEASCIAEDPERKSEAKASNITALTTSQGGENLCVENPQLISWQPCRQATKGVPGLFGSNFCVRAK